MLLIVECRLEDIDPDLYVEQKEDKLKYSASPESKGMLSFTIDYNLHHQFLQIIIHAANNLPTHSRTNEVLGCFVRYYVISII